MISFVTNSFSLRSRLAFGSALLLLLSGLIGGDLRAQGCGGAGQLQQSTNSGTEFLLCFEQNHLRQPEDDEYLEIYLATLDQPASITVTSNRYPRLNRQIFLGARQSFVYRITDDTVQYHGIPRQADTLVDLWMTSSGSPDDRVVRVVSSAPIICYGMNHKISTTDACLALPKGTAGTEYRIMSYPNSTQLSGDETPSQFAVAAFVDNTTVTITPSAPTVGGHAAGVPFQVRLNAGQGVQVQTDEQFANLDLTGSHVIADEPVAVYGSHARTEIPLNYTQPGGETSRDHLIEAMPPVATWGRTFVLSAIEVNSSGQKRPQGDLMRVLAVNDNTNVLVNGQPWTTLSSDHWADSMIVGPVVVQSSQPVLVAEYAHTATKNHDLGDPFMAIVPPVDQSYNDFTFFASSDPAFTLQKVIIAARVEAIHSDTNRAVSKIQFDNNLMLPSSFFQVLPTVVNGNQYAITQLQVQPGAHTLRSDVTADKGFTILSYGLGDVDSYGYTAGILLRPLTTMVGGMTPPSIEHRNELWFRNTTAQSLYLDSAVVVPDSVDVRSIGLHVKERVAYDIGRMGVAETQTIHLVSDRPIGSRITGTVLVYSHTPTWDGIEPTAIRFAINPASTEAVAQNRTACTLSSYPNPFTEYTTLAVGLPERADLRILLVDEMGRVAKNVAETEFAAGTYNIRIDRGGLPAGYYTLVVSSSKLGLNERRGLVIE